MTDPAPTGERAADNVIQALTRVIRDLPAIGKEQQASSQQGGYSYRGIEQITGHTQRLFAEHGIVFTPRVVHYETRDLLVNSKPWTDTITLVEYDVYGPGGIEDKITIGPLLSIGRDNSDKGATKCLTQAFKYALLQALCISDAKDDADGTTHEADAPPVQVEHPVYVERLLAAVKDLTDDQRAELRGWLSEKGLPDRPAKMDEAQAGAVLAHVASLAAQGPQDAPGQGSGPDSPSEVAEAVEGVWQATDAWLKSLDAAEYDDLLASYELATTGSPSTKLKRLETHLRKLHDEAQVDQPSLV